MPGDYNLLSVSLCLGYYNIKMVNFILIFRLGLFKISSRVAQATLKVNIKFRMSSNSDPPDCTPDLLTATIPTLYFKSYSLIVLKMIPNSKIFIKPIIKKRVARKPFKEKAPPSSSSSLYFWKEV